MRGRGGLARAEKMGTRWLEGGIVTAWTRSLFSHNCGPRRRKLSRFGRRDTPFLEPRISLREAAAADCVVVFRVCRMPGLRTDAVNLARIVPAANLRSVTILATEMVVHMHMRVRQFFRRRPAASAAGRRRNGRCRHRCRRRGLHAQSLCGLCVQLLYLKRAGARGRARPQARPRSHWSRLDMLFLSSRVRGEQK